MPQVPNDAARDVVYLNGFLLHEGGPVGSFDATIMGTGIASPTAIRLGAVFGVWRDCDGDGYIGSRLAGSHGAFGAYPRALALQPIDEAVCPPGSIWNPTDAATNSPNGLIDEFRAIGPRDPLGECPECGEGERPDPDDLYEPASRVWADWGAPGGPHSRYDGAAGGLPEGTMHDSNGALAYADALLIGRLSETLGPTWRTIPTIGACPEDPRLLTGSTIGISSYQVGTCGLWPLWQVERVLGPSGEDQPESLLRLWGSEEDTNGDGAACNDQLDLALGDRRVAIDRLAPRISREPATRGSVRGTVSDAHRATGGLTFDGSCGDGTTTPAFPESEQDSIETTHRRPSDTLVHRFDVRSEALAEYGFANSPPDLGVGVVSGPASLVGDNGGGWVGSTAWVARPPRVGWAWTTNSAVTFYADASSESLAKHNYGLSPVFPSRGGFRYGTDACTTILTGPPAVNALGWDCSHSSWLAKRAADGAPSRPVLGDSYRLRDVDCYDNEIGDAAPPSGVVVRIGIADCSSVHA